MTTRVAQIVAAMGLCAISAGAFADEHYNVSVKISDAGQEFAASEFVARTGEAATVEVSGTDSYALTLTIDPLPDGTLKASTDLKSNHGAMAPVVILKPGKAASVAIGDLSITLTAAPGGA